MKTKEELIALKEEVETLNKKLAELTEEDLAQVSGGGEGDDIVFQFEYEPYIMVYYKSSLGAYVMKDTLKGNERIAWSAGDLEDVACELKKLREST